MALIEFTLNKGNGPQRYYWTVRSAGNHQTLATSEMYYNRQDAIDAANLVRTGGGPDADFWDHTGEQ